MFLWKKPIGLKTFGMTAERAESTSVLAANQGLYNGFLAAGLIWSLICPDPIEAWHLQLFFLSCVAIAGLYGGYSVSIKILYLQALPAILALLFLVLSIKFFGQT
jgi:putative membrane protein